MHDLLMNTIFYIFAGLTVISALLVVTQNNPVRCVLFLVLAFICSSVLWLLVGAEFLALILVLVYVGAVMTLFLFVVMMLNIDVESMKTHMLRYLPFGLIIVALLVGLVVKVIPSELYLNAVQTSAGAVQPASSELLDSPILLDQRQSNTEALGDKLYTEYALAFELAAAILLVAIIAAITLVHRAPIRSKRQNVVDQMMTRRDDRVELINMRSEK